MKTLVYIDGFNLYYQIRKTAYKWLNLDVLVRSLLSNNQVLEVKYYTAMVKDYNGATRQKNYLRALESIPKISVHFGRFKVEDSWMRPFGGGAKIRVEKTVEKQTDVTLGADMVHDAHQNLADCFVLLSNDSDLCRPVEIIRSDLGKSVIVLNPNPDYPAGELHRKATQVIKIGHKALQRAQFPHQMSDKNGSFSIPHKWYWPDDVSN